MEIPNEATDLSTESNNDIVSNNTTNEEDTLKAKCLNCSEVFDGSLVITRIKKLEELAKQQNEKLRLTEDDNKTLQSEIKSKEGELNCIITQGFSLTIELGKIMREKATLENKLASLGLNADPPMTPLVPVQMSQAGTYLRSNLFIQVRHGVDFQSSNFPMNHWFCLCGRYFTSKHDCMEHLQQRTLLHEERLICSVCMNLFESWACFEKHMKDEHGEIQI